MSHKKVEKNIALMVLLILFVISFGGIAEIVPQFFVKQNVKPIKGLKPYTALQLEGRDIYIREGCHVCHTQMIRPLQAETERYGHYTQANEDVYEHPFLWGSKRIGPDIARVGGRYSAAWMRQHLINPQSLVPDSIMPAYPWLAKNKLTGKWTARKMIVMREIGVPYTDADIKSAAEDVKGKTELTALVAYLQTLGTMIKTKE